MRSAPSGHPGPLRLAMAAVVAGFGVYVWLQAGPVVSYLVYQIEASELRGVILAEKRWTTGTADLADVILLRMPTGAECLMLAALEVLLAVLSRGMPRWLWASIVASPAVGAVLVQVCFRI